MTALGLDLAERTGWAVGERGKKPVVRFVDLPGFSDRDLPRTMGSIYSLVFHICREHKVTLVGLEAALRGLKKRNQRGVAIPVSAHGERVLTMLSGAAIAGAANAGARVLVPIAPATWRAEVLGCGFPEDPKKAAVDYCRLMKWDVPNDDHNAAEAACIMVYVQGRLVGLQ